MYGCQVGQWFSNFIVQQNPKGLVKTVCKAPFLSFSFGSSRVGPENFHFWEIPRWCCCFWFRGLRLRTTDIENWKPVLFSVSLSVFFFCILPRYVSHLFPKLCHSQSVNHSKDFLASFPSAVSKIQWPSNAPLQGPPFPKAEE